MREMREFPDYVKVLAVGCSGISGGRLPSVRFGWKARSEAQDAEEFVAWEAKKVSGGERELVGRGGDGGDKMRGDEIGS